jgi:hypothetical protein
VRTRSLVREEEINMLIEADKKVWPTASLERLEAVSREGANR